MRPRFHVRLTPADRVTIAVWTRRVLMVWALIVVSLVAYAFVAPPERSTAEHPKAQSASHAPAGPR